MDYSEIVLLAREVRKSFEKREIPQEKLERVYFHYNSLKDIKTFIERALRLFPRGNCGLASVYLQQFLPSAEVIRGNYGLESHTFLLLDETVVIDITADQFGGPEVYVGLLKEPWRIDSISSLL